MGCRRKTPVNKVYKVSVEILMNTEKELEDRYIKLHLEYAMNAACSELEDYCLSPTYKLGELKKI